MAALEPGTLYNDDNLDRLGTFPDESVDLVYLDPPFFSNRVYEVIWGDEAEVRSFEDRWEGGVQHYVGWMRDRVEQLHRVLKPTGSLYLHCDPHASHYLKVMLDQVFGQSMFRNEIIWRRTGANKSQTMFGPLHQTIFFYAKSATTGLNPVYTPYTRDYIESQFTLEDERGRFRSVLLTGPGVRNGDSGQPWGGYDPTKAGRHWQPASYIYGKYQEVTGDDLAQYPLLERLDRLDDAELLYRGLRGKGVPNYRYYLNDAPGVPLQDIWAFQPGTQGCIWNDPDTGIDEDVKWIGANDAERLGYPTQKPEGLLERIVRASSSEGDIVLDPFCGCGTTIAVAERLQREWVGIDISPTAMEVMQRRLWNQSRLVPAIVGAPESLDDLKRLKPFEFQNWVINQIHGTHSPRKSGDMGIDGFTFLDKSPVQVKQSESVGRNVVDNFETAIRRAGNDTGHVIAFSFTKGAVEEAARAKWEDRLDIRLVRISTLLKPEEQRPEPLRRPEGDIVPLPPMRKPNELPTAEELIESDVAAG